MIKRFTSTRELLERTSDENAILEHDLNSQMFVLTEENALKCVNVIGDHKCVNVIGNHIDTLEGILLAPTHYSCLTSG